MATMKLTTQQQVEDFVRGCTFFATGGGGLPANGRKSLMDELSMAVTFFSRNTEALSVGP